MRALERFNKKTQLNGKSEKTTVVMLNSVTTGQSRYLNISFRNVV